MSDIEDMHQFLDQKFPREEIKEDYDSYISWKTLWGEFLWVCNPYSKYGYRYNNEKNSYRIKKSYIKDIASFGGISLNQSIRTTNKTYCL